MNAASWATKKPLAFNWTSWNDKAMASGLKAIAFGLLIGPRGMISLLPIASNVHRRTFNWTSWNDKLLTPRVLRF